MANVFDNYNNKIITFYHHDTNTTYELVYDKISGYYINLNADNKCVIIAKFPNYNIPESSAYFFACLFWEALLNYQK